MGVTNIKYWVNRTAGNVSIIKIENSESITLAPNAWFEKDMWVPWCTNDTEFAQKVMKILIDQPRREYYIWQNGNSVCYSTQERWEHPARAIPGVSQVDGNRRLTIDAAGNISLSRA